MLIRRYLVAIGWIEEGEMGTLDFGHVRRASPFAGPRRVVLSDGLTVCCDWSYGMLSLSGSGWPRGLDRRRADSLENVDFHEHWDEVRMTRHEFPMGTSPT